MKKKPCILLYLLSCLSALLLPVINVSAEETLYDRILQETESYLQHRFMDEERVPPESQLTLTIKKIDPRIEVPLCQQPYSYSTETDALEKSVFSVRVSCEKANWFTYTSVRVNFTKSTVVTSGVVSPNTVLTSSNLRIEQVDVNKARHTGFSRIEEVLGARMKFRVRDGQPVQRRMLCYVCEGDRITIAARVGSMEVKTSGIAQQDGTLGETIEVKNTRSQKSVFGQVKNTQEVVVNL